MARYTNPPLPRHAALQPFSRDHYVGLVQAKHLTASADATDADRRKAVREFLDAWQSDIVVHFDDEERLLINLLDEAGKDQLLKEHGRLRELAAEANERRRAVDPGAEWVRELGQLLNDHIRWEERELFPSVQQQADDAELQALEAQTQVIEKSRNRGRRV